MKTKFSPIVHLYKQNMQRHEQSITDNERKIADKKMQIDEIADEITQLEIPKSNMLYTFKGHEELKRMLLFSLKTAQNELEELLAHQNILQEQYKKHRLEFEKMSYLNKKEQDKILKSLQDAEKKESNQIALMLYNHNGIYK